ncbi:MAG: T9SS type A sorting domain-containing protein [Candidatus Neomarinimicrobiota bacterium]
MKKIIFTLILSKVFTQESTVPLNLICTDSSLANTGLEWQVPGAFQYHNETHFNGYIWNGSGIGQGDGSDVGFFQKLTGTMLSAHHGKKIHSLEFISRAQATFQPLVFEISGLGNPDIVNLTDCILSSPASSHPDDLMAWIPKPLYDYTIGNEMGDTTSISSKIIDSTKTYIFGVIISEYEMGTYPMGVDTGPEIDGFGNMMANIYSDENTASGYNIYLWQTLSENNPDLTFNWALKLHLIEDVSLAHYNIYENDTILNSVDSDCYPNYCLDQRINLGPRGPGQYEYYVTSVYNYGETESEASNIVQVNVSNTPPGDFNTVEPEDGEVYDFSENELYQDISFIWRDSEDVDGHSLTYNLEICNQNNDFDFCWDTTLIQNEDLIVGSFCRFEIEVEKMMLDLDINDNLNALIWNVVAFDGFDSTEVVGGNSIFYLNFDFLEISVEPLVSVFRLGKNYPNPFNPSTSFTYFIPKDEIIDIRIFDLNGKVVKNLVKEKKRVGHNSIKWDATNEQGQKVSAGVYLYSIEAAGFRQTKKMILLK